MPYPDGTDVQRELEGAGILPQNVTDARQSLYGEALDDVAKAAWQEWEARTKFRPFLAGTADTSWEFTPDGSNLVDFQGGFVSVTSLTTDVTPTFAGNLLTANTNYRLMPENAAADGKPYTYASLGRPRYRPTTTFSRIVVVGKRGAYAVLPARAKRAILAYACHLLVPTLTHWIGQGGYSYTEADVTEKNVANALLTQGESWLNLFESAALLKDFRRL